MSDPFEELQGAFQALAPATQPPKPAAEAAGPAPEPAAVSPAVPAGPQAPDPKVRGFHFDATVEPAQIVAAAEALDRCGFAIDTVTGVDWMGAGQMEVVYDFYHPLKHLQAVVRTRVPRECPELPTISQVYPGANWHERETHDFFGIRFLGHPDLTPFLLPEDADYHPLRKDFPGAS